jgi:hypothetical protein
MIVGFPLLLIPIAIVNIIAFLMPGVSLGAPLYAVPLPSNVSWTITFSDALLAFGMLMLFFEVAKTARPGGKYLTDHLLSILLFGAAAAEFVLLPQFGNSTFFLLTVLTFIDVISSIAIRMRQRGFVEASPRRSRTPVQPRSEPPIAPAPAPVPPVSEPRIEPVSEAPVSVDAAAEREPALQDSGPAELHPDAPVPDRPPQPGR